MKRKFVAAIIIAVCILGMGVKAYAYDIEEQIIYNLKEEVPLERAFIKLERISNYEISFYFDNDVNLEKKFRILAGGNTYKNILDLVLQFNNLKKIRLAEQLFYIYPKAKQSKYETEQKMSFKENKRTKDKIKWHQYLEKPETK